MKTLLKHWMLALAFAGAMTSTAPAQQTPIEIPPDNKALGEIVRVGSDATLATNEAARTITVINGAATISGAVQHEVFVMSGPAHITGPVGSAVVCFGGDVTIDSRVNGHVAVLFGSLKLGPNAEVRDGVRVIGGNLESDPSATIHRGQAVVNFPLLRQFGGWLTQGLLFARPFPPRVSLAWLLAGVLFAIHLVLAMMFPRAVTNCVETVAVRPVGSVFAGLLVLLLVGPLFVLLVASGVGILAVPFLLSAVIGGLFIGKVGAYRYVGRQLGRQLKLAVLERPAVSLLGGTVVFYLLYLIPIIGLIAWGLITLLGFGGVVIATLASFRRDSTEEVPTVLVKRKPAAGSQPEAAPDVVALPRVGFWLRFTAMALDAVLLVFVSLVLHVAPLLPVIWLAYHVGMWSWRGTTLGGMALGLRIVRLDGTPINFTVALVRSLASLFSALVLFLGFFWAGWSRERQSWHDMIAGTAIIRVPRDLVFA